MPDCQCERLDQHFDSKVAEDDLRTYRRSGPDRSTELLLGRLRALGVEGRTLLDVGGGVGIIPLELLPEGLRSATDVDASAAYIEVARREATARGIADRINYRQGDFVEVAPAIEPADIVTLDRVICCYPGLEELASAAADCAGKVLGIVHPHDRWWARAGMTVLNVVGRVFRKPAFFVHRTARLEAILRSAGLEREWVGGTFFWRVAIYLRVADVSR